MPVKRAIWEAGRLERSGRILVGLLNLSKGDIHEENDGDYLHELLTLWMQRGQATIQDILNALEDVTVGRIDIVNQIRAQKHSGSVKESHAACQLVVSSSMYLDMYTCMHYNEHGFVL